MTNELYRVHNCTEEKYFLHDIVLHSDLCGANTSYIHVLYSMYTYYIHA